VTSSPVAYVLPPPPEALSLPAGKILGQMRTMMNMAAPPERNKEKGKKKINMLHSKIK
jgi:hypothetical protein